VIMIKYLQNAVSYIHTYIHTYITTYIHTICAIITYCR